MEDNSYLLHHSSNETTTTATGRQLLGSRQLLESVSPNTMASNQLPGAGVSKDREASPRATFKKPTFKKIRSAKGGMRNKRPKAGDGNGGSSEEDNVEVVKANKQARKAVNSFSTGGTSAGSEARAAAR